MADLSDYTLIEEEIDQLLAHLSEVQLQYIAMMVTGLQGLGAHDLANKKVRSRLMQAWLKNSDVQRIFEGALKSRTGNIVSYEFAIVDSRLQRALQAGALSRIQEVSSYQQAKDAMIAKAMRTTQQMLDIKTMQLDANLGALARKIKSGQVSTQEALKQAVVNTASSAWSVPVKTKSGIQHWDAERLINRQVRNDIKNIAIERTDAVLEKNRINLVEISSHGGSRPDHALWQGGVFWVHTPVKGYQHISVTRKGYPDGLGGVNCRHRESPFFPGIDPEPDPTRDPPIDETLYEQTQTLRRLEHQARTTETKNQMLLLVGEHQYDTMARQRRSEAKSYAHEHGLTSRI